MDAGGVPTAVDEVLYINLDDQVFAVYNSVGIAKQPQCLKRFFQVRLKDSKIRCLNLSVRVQIHRRTIRMIS